MADESTFQYIVIFNNRHGTPTLDVRRVTITRAAATNELTVSSGQSLIAPTLKTTTYSGMAHFKMYAGEGRTFIDHVRFMLAAAHAKIPAGQGLVPVLFLGARPDAWEGVKERIDSMYFVNGTRFRVDEGEVASGLMGRAAAEYFAVKTTYGVVSTLGAHPRAHVYRYQYVPRASEKRLFAGVQEVFDADGLPLAAIRAACGGEGSEITVFLPAGHASVDAVNGAEGFHVREVAYAAEDVAGAAARTEIARRALSQRKKYMLVLDAGSSGTRMYVFEWDQQFGADGAPLLAANIRKPDPGWQSAAQELVLGGGARLNLKGLGHLATGDNGAPTSDRVVIAARVAAHLAPCFAGAHAFFNTDERRGVVASTRLYMLATAGMRKLKQDSLERYTVLRGEVTRYLNLTPYCEPLYDTISGEAEGILGWVAANYVAETFHAAADEAVVPRGFMEMGGQSMQIAFVPAPADRRAYDGALTQIALGGATYDVFTRSWLHLGFDAVLRAHEARVRQQPPTHDNRLADPCFPRGYEYKVKRADEHETEVTVTGTADLSACVEEAFELLRCGDGECRAGRLCAFDPAQRRGCLLQAIPGLGFGNASTSFIGASVFFHATHGAFAHARERRPWYNLVSFWAEVQELFGARDWAAVQAARPGENPQWLKEAFFKAGLIMAVVHLGFGMPMGALATQQVKMVLRKHLKEQMREGGGDDVINLVVQCLEPPLSLADALPPIRLHDDDDPRDRQRIDEVVLQVLQRTLQVRPDRLHAGGDADDDTTDSPRQEARRVIEALQQVIRVVQDSDAQDRRRAGLRAAIVGPLRAYQEIAANAAEMAAVRAVLKDTVMRILFGCLLVEEAAAGAVDDGRFGARQDADWALGKVVLESVYATPRKMYREGWKKPEDDEEEDEQADDEEGEDEDEEEE
ncbi:nucleoside phosphatase family-domain-containing protein [Peziza echinospora]|nr:nucleoside phosphatase family-domain-containing protein [Peziza echinospora]